MNTKRIIATLGMVAAMLTVSVAYSENDAGELRAGGQSAVDALHRRLLKGEIDEAMLDRVCAQKDCGSSRLFWYTDLEEAKAAAHRNGRPILALTMLGRLDEELSCANSRFFRTLLYSDDSISEVMRDQYIVYWHSVRSVPRVTIDLGEGRVIRQTITGNSVHYLLSEEGEVLDALPGLYSPAAFRDQLERWLTLHRSLNGLSAEARRDILTRYHAERLEVLGENPYRIALASPTAEDASAIAATKGVPEIPLLRQLQAGAQQRLAPWPSSIAVNEERIRNVVFSPSSMALMERKQRLTDELLNALHVSVASDTFFNESALHPRIHRWFVDGQVPDLATLNERIYRELFLTPPDDPWMGLKPPSAFTALAE
jgi:hypothetical protein